MKTVVHLIDTGGPGGAEMLFHQLTSGLDASGFRSVPVISRDGWLAEKIRAGGLAPRILPSKGSMNLGYLRRLAGALREERADLLVAHLYGSAIYGSLAGLITRTPVIAILHGQTDVGSGERFASLKAAAVRHGADRVVFVSAQLLDDLRTRLSLDAARCRVIENGVDMAAFRPARNDSLRRELGLASSDLLVGTVGNIREPKDYHSLLQAAQRVRIASTRIHFAHVGEGSNELHQSLLAERERLGLTGSFHFLGLRNNIAELLNNFDIFALSSTTEGFSIACVEAMACAVPLIATRSGGPETIVEDEISGLLVPVASPGAMATAILRVADDPALRARLAANGRVRAESHFSHTRMIARYRTLIDELLNPRA
jgi:glycosyltransferase involved in cell wall biosynthesis